MTFGLSPLLVWAHFLFGSTSCLSPLPVETTKYVEMSSMIQAYATKYYYISDSVKVHVHFVLRIKGHYFVKVNILLHGKMNTNTFIRQTYFIFIFDSQKAASQCFHIV